MLLWLLRAAMAPAPAGQGTAPARLRVQLIPLPAPQSIEPSRPIGRPKTAARAVHRQGVPVRTLSPPLKEPDAVMPAPTEADRATHAELPASSPQALPSLLDTEASRRAIRASARAPSLGEQLGRARDEPGRADAQQVLGSAVRAAGKGDCAKGDFAGAGMGLLSLPFLAAAVARGECAK